MAPGIYTGGGSGTVLFSGTISGSTEQSFSISTPIEISTSGIPILDGSEVIVGDVFFSDVGGFYSESTVTSVSVSSDGVVTRYDSILFIDIPEASAVLTGGGSTVLKRISQTTIQYQDSSILSGFDGVETVTITSSSSGVFTR